MFGIRHRNVPHLGYGIHFSLSSLDFLTFLLEKGAKPRGRVANKCEHTSAVEYAVMSNDGEYISVARKRPGYNVLQKEKLLKYGLVLSANLSRVISLCLLS
jgi:hypothetical protein